MNIASGNRADPTDAALRILADEQRRHVVASLSATSDGVSSLSELVEYAVTRATDERDPEEATIHLHHVTLPKLEDAGLLEYDSRSRAVRYYRNPLVEHLLDSLRAEGWSDR